MKYYHAADRYLRKQFRERTIILFYITAFLTLLVVLGTSFIYLNIMSPQLPVNLGLPIYYAVFAMLLLMRGIAFRYLPSLVDAAVLRRRLRIDIAWITMFVLIGAALHLSIVEAYAAAGDDIPFPVLAAEGVASLLLLIGSAVHLTSMFFSRRWRGIETELTPMDAGDA